MYKQKHSQRDASKLMLFPQSIFIGKRITYTSCYFAASFPKSLFQYLSSGYVDHIHNHTHLTGMTNCVPIRIYPNHVCLNEFNYKYTYCNELSRDTLSPSSPKLWSMQPLGVSKLYVNTKFYICNRKTKYIKGYSLATLRVKQHKTTCKTKRLIVFLELTV